MIDYDPKSWLRVLVRVHGSVLPSLLPRVALTAAVGVAAVYLQRTYRFSLPSTVHTLVGVALGLLLVFRTNASYDRYWEGRKLFGTLINRSRDLARQVTAYLDGDGDEARIERSKLQRLITLEYALIRQYIRKERDLDALGIVLTKEERIALEPVVVRPTVGITWLSRAIAANVEAGRIKPVAMQLMDANVTALIDAWGGAERIVRTPIPFAYAHHIKGFLSLFCLTVPFVLVDAMKSFTPLAAAIVSYGMFGIEEIGVEIEDPFGYDANDLALDRFGETIARDTGDILATRDALRPPAA